MQDHFDSDYEESEFPLAYLLTFRTYGTWLHGDERKSVERNGRNIYGTPKRDVNIPLAEFMLEEMDQPPFILGQQQRSAVESAISEVCINRGYVLHAANCRTNHAHAVVSAQMKPERIIDSFKAYATRRMREDGLFPLERKIWSRGRSRRYLWKPHHVDPAIDYTLYSQGLIPFELEEWDRFRKGCKR